MRIDCTAYRTSLDNIKNGLIRSQIEKKESINRMINNISLSTGVPLIAVVDYLMQDDLLGALPELKAMEESLVKFYGYKEIVSFRKI